MPVLLKLRSLRAFMGSVWIPLSQMNDMRTLDENIQTADLYPYILELFY